MTPEPSPSAKEISRLRAFLLRIKSCTQEDVVYGLACEALGDEKSVPPNHNK